MRFRLFTALLTIAISQWAMAADTPSKETAFFESKIRPVLIEHCYACHSDKAPKLKGGLRLDTKSGWEKGGDSGATIIAPGKPDGSSIVKALQHFDGLEMPPGKKLPATVVADFVSWIKAGAHDPRIGQVELKRADKSWWSLQPLTKVQPPNPTGIPKAWAESPIDRFIFAKMQEKGLKPSTPADPRTLIRRLSYDLTGLPPTYEEVEAFTSDYAKDSRKATEILVDRLLDSPRYGEQWGRHWLDVVRFGESNGFERNVLIDDLWQFRDYVIRSFNQDRPFDKVIIEHLAGDVVGKGDPNIEVATSFLVCGPYDNVGNQNKEATLNIRAVTLDDMVSTTGSAFLGLTINCARCHNHKFDPIPTEDYYRIRAAFEGVTHGNRILASEKDRAAYDGKIKPMNQLKTQLTMKRDTLERSMDARAKVALKNRKYSKPKANPELTEERFDTVDAKYVRFIMLAHSGNPQSAVGARLDEFEVWSAGKTPRNVALAANGGKATGTQQRVAEDFAGAYGPELTIDGQFGARWFIGTPSELLITLPKVEKIDRVKFSNAREGRIENGKLQGEFPVEYRVEVSTDGKTWTTVTTSADREPWSQAHANERVRREVTTTDERKELVELNKQLADLQKKLLVIEPLPKAWAGIFKPVNEPTFVHKSGDPLKPGEAVLPTSLAVLDKVTKPYVLKGNSPESERRLALAQWIVSNDNPLTARVLVNRLWHYHFGTGIVDTPSDFGYLGGKPTHPELLDWLAGRLHHHGWQLKALQREIVLSQTYLQISEPRNEAIAIDKDSRYLWRFPPRRLAGEELRDTILSVSGKLNLKPGGPGFRLYQYKQDNVSTYVPLDTYGPETYRRAVYHQNARASIVDILSDYDFPDTALPAPRRVNTTTPLQALTLLNHKFTLDMAKALADRVAGSKSVSDQVIKVYKHILQRKPNEAELQTAIELVNKHGLPALCRAMLNLNELVYIE